MLSFGMEYERAFSIAFCSARLPAGSGPPSFAATMIARESLEKSLPRFASAAPFLCLIDDHLLCPDIHPLDTASCAVGKPPGFPKPLPLVRFADGRLRRRLANSIEEQLVYPRILRQLGVERRDEEATLPQED